MSGPRVGVAVPTIPTRTKLLRRALTSVWGQTRDPDSVAIAVDRDAEGAGPTRNRAWRMLDTEWVAVLDDDDQLMDNFLETMLATAMESGGDAIYGWFELRGWPEATPWRPDPLAVPVNGQLVHPLGVPFGPEQAAHLKRYACLPVTALIRRELLEEVGGWPTPGTPEWPRADCEDWGGWLRFLDAGARIVHCPTRNWICNVHAGSTAGRPWRETARR